MANDHYNPEMREELDEQYQELRDNAKLHTRDWFDKNENNVDKQQVRQAERLGMKIGTALLTSRWDDVIQYENELQKIVQQMNSDTKKKFKQQMYLARLSSAGERAYDRIVILLDLTELPLIEQRAYSILNDIFDTLTGGYVTDATREVLRKRYNAFKSQLLAIKPPSPAFEYALKRRMEYVEEKLNTTSRRQRKTKAPVRRKAPTTARSAAPPKQSSFMDRIVKISGVRLKKR